MNTLAGYHEYIGECSVHRGGGREGIMMHVGENIVSTSGMFSTSGDSMSRLGGYHEYIGRCPVRWRDYDTGRGASW